MRYVGITKKVLMGRERGGRREGWRQGGREGGKIPKQKRADEQNRIRQSVVLRQSGEI